MEVVHESARRDQARHRHNVKVRAKADISDVDLNVKWR